MARHFKIAQTLSQAHFEAFHNLIVDHRMTVNSLHEWLTVRGYKFSRSTVGHYRRVIVDRHAGFDRLGVRATDAGVRRQLAQWAGRLPGSELRTLAAFASFLFRTSKARRKVK